VAGAAALARAAPGPAPPWPVRGRRAAQVRWALAWARSILGRVRTRRLGRKLEDEAVRWYLDMWRQAAAEAGAEFRDLGDGFSLIERDGHRVRAHRQRLSVDDPVTLRLAGKKPLVLAWLQERGLPVPPHLAFRHDDLAPAWRFLHDQGVPCVVKPAEGTGGGRGVTTGVRRARELARAAAQAAVYGPRLLIEREVPGDAYRLLYLDGALVSVVRRGPPTVTGDGRSTVARLIAQENQRRRSRPELAILPNLEADGDCAAALRAARLTLRSVPAAGAAVAVRRATNLGGEADGEDLTDRVGEALVQQGAAAAAAVGVRLAGVDVITADPSRPLEDAGGVVLEVNTTPGLHIHVLVRNRRSPSVGATLLERLLRPLASRA
jgi:D-alanine-D-alanine ligase-like ATP-grasp enzyme